HVARSCSTRPANPGPTVHPLPGRVKTRVVVGRCHGWLRLRLCHICGMMWALQVAREKDEGAAIQGRDAPEVPLVEGQEAARAVTMSQDDDCEVGQAEVKGGIAVVQCERQAMLLLRQPLDAETALGK